MEHKNSNNTYTVTLEQDGDDLILPIPDKILEELDINIGDVLQFIDNGDGTFSLIKMKYDSDGGLTESF